MCMGVRMLVCECVWACLCACAYMCVWAQMWHGARVAFLVHVCMDGRKLFRTCVSAYAGFETDAVPVEIRCFKCAATTSRTEPLARHVYHERWRGDVIALQVLVLTHELATTAERMPYLAVRLAPIQVVECFGRAAAQYPRCRREHAVWSWWQELLQVFFAINFSLGCRVGGGRVVGQNLIFPGAFAGSFVPGRGAALHAGRAVPGRPVVHRGGIGLPFLRG